MDALLLPRNEKRSCAEPPRMMPLAKLPVFWALDGRRVVVAGGSDAAAWKAELLAACGAEVHVYAAFEELGEVCTRLLEAAPLTRAAGSSITAKPGQRKRSSARRLRSPTARLRAMPKPSSRRPKRPACRSTSSTNRPIASFSSAPSSIARLSSCPYRLMAPLNLGFIRPVENIGSLNFASIGQEHYLPAVEKTSAPLACSDSAPPGMRSGFVTVTSLPNFSIL